MLNKLVSSLSLLIVFSLFGMSVPAIPVTGQPIGQLADISAVNPINTLDEFTQSLVNGNSSQIVGVYVDSTFAYPIVQQPASNPGFVSTEDGKVTQFASASRYGSIGLIAHNNLAGAGFSLLQVGDVITLVYGDGSARNYSVNQIRQFQALSPTNPYSTFIDLDNPGTILDVSTVFYDIYAADGRLVLQTCIAKDGVDSWGRLFVVAEPVETVTSAE
jgi:hypothetical protein